MVVAVYHKQTFGIPDRPGGVIRVKETLTDKEGRVTIPSYTTLINPFAWSLRVGFTIFKPGSGSVDDFPVEDVFHNKAPEYPEVPELWNMELQCCDG